MDKKGSNSVQFYRRSRRFNQVEYNGNLYLSDYPRWHVMLNEKERQVALAISYRVDSLESRGFGTIVELEKSNYLHAILFLLFVFRPRYQIEFGSHKTLR